MDCRWVTSAVGLEATEASTLISPITHPGKSQLPCCVDTQAAQQRGPHGATPGNPPVSEPRGSGSRSPSEPADDCGPGRQRLRPHEGALSQKRPARWVLNS